MGVCSLLLPCGLWWLKSALRLGSEAFTPEHFKKGNVEVRRVTGPILAVPTVFGDIP